MTWATKGEERQSQVFAEDPLAPGWAQAEPASF